MYLNKGIALSVNVKRFEDTSRNSENLSALDNAHTYMTDSVTCAIGNRDLNWIVPMV